MTVSPRSKLSSAWESSTEQDKTNELLSPSNSHIKSEEIEIGEIKLDTIGIQNEYNISNTKYLSDVYSVRTECNDLIKTETQALSETVNNIKQEIDIKYEPLDPANDYCLTNQYLSKINNVKLEFIELDEIDKERLEETKKSNN